MKTQTEIAKEINLRITSNCNGRADDYAVHLANDSYLEGFQEADKETQAARALVGECYDAIEKSYDASMGGHVDLIAELERKLAKWGMLKRPATNPEVPQT